MNVAARWMMVLRFFSTLHAEETNDKCVKKELSFYF